MNKQVIYKAIDKQVEYFKAVFSGLYKYLLIGGGVRGGKTFALLGAALLLLKKYPGSKCVIIRDTLQNLKLTTIPSFWKMWPSNFVERYNQETQTVYMKNGSQVLFFGENFADDKSLDRFKGLEANIICLDEANEIQEETFHKCIERCGTHVTPGEKPPPLILLSCNPSQTWVKTLFYDRWKDGTLPPDWYYLPSLIKDNPYMQDPAYLASLEHMPRYQYEVFVLGNWDIALKTGAEAYRSFDLDKHVGKCEYDNKLPLHISFDENVNPYISLVIFQVAIEEDDERATITKHVRLIDEILGRHPNNTIESVCRLFKRKYPAHRSGMFVYGDATSRKSDTKLETGHNLYSLISGYLGEYMPSVRVLNSNPSVVMRLNFFNSVLEKEFENIRFLIDEHCKESINDFQSTKEDSDGTKLKQVIADPKTKVRFQAHGHLTDACDYFLVSAFRSAFAKYQTGGRTGSGVISMGKNPSKNDYR